MQNKIKKERLDIILVNQKYFESREKAKIAIIEGKVFVNDQKEDKPGTMIKEDAKIIVKGEKLKYCSRGGLKLEKALKEFNVNIENFICLDIGSSTGGFTDCMLQNGAKKVYAIDCGTNQLDYKLRINEKVVSLENTNARFITNETIKNDEFNFVTIDVSFISLKKILPTIINLIEGKKIKENVYIICLIKPQFEAGRMQVNKGIITDKKIHMDIVLDMINFVKDLGFFIKGISYSPIKGPKGNIEYLLYLSNENSNQDLDSIIYNAKEVVLNSHNELDK